MWMDGALGGLMNCGWISGRTDRWMADGCRSRWMENCGKWTVAGWASARMVGDRFNDAGMVTW